MHPPIILRACECLGIDYGARRIGLALSDATATLASPWRMLQRPPSEAETLRLLITEITSLKNEDDGLAAVVVGWPRRLDGSPNRSDADRRNVRARLEGEDRRAGRSCRTSGCRAPKPNRDWRVAKRTGASASSSSMPRRRPIILQDYLDSVEPSREQETDECVRWIKRLVLLVVLIAIVAGAGGWWIYRR